MAKRRYALARRRAPARRRSGPSRGFLQAKKRATAASKRATAVRKKYSGRAGGLKMGASVVAGGALGGAANGLLGEIFGMDADIAIAIGMLAVGMYNNKSTPILMAAGIGARYAAEYTEDLMASGEFALPFAAAGGGEP